MKKNQGHMNVNNFILRIIGVSVLFLHISLAQSQNKSVFPSPGFYEEIPYDYVLGKILIPVTIGNHTYTFIYDTGGALIISNRVKKEANLEVVKTANVSGINKISKKVNVIHVPSTKIGTLEYQNFNATEIDLFDKLPATCYGADGLIGRDFMENIIVQIDPIRQILILTDQVSRLNLANASSTRLFLDKRIEKMPKIKAKVNGKKMKFTFDSGSNKLLSFKSAKVEEWIQANKVTRDKPIIHFGNASLGVSGQIPPPSKSYQLKIDELQLAGIRFTEFFSDKSLKSRSRIGTGLLEYGIITLDYINKRFYYKPFDNHTMITPTCELYSGFSQLHREGESTVASIQLGSAVEKAGLALGDVIIQVDETIFTGMSDEEFCQRYTSEKPDTKQVTITFKNVAGKIQKLVVDKYLLY